jgi:hypothetical protein
MPPRVSRWFNDSIAIERGPLVFSYGIVEDWVKLRDRGMTADWQVFPSSSLREITCARTCLQPTIKAHAAPKAQGPHRF